MNTYAPSSLRRTWHEIFAMLAIAALALACLVAVAYGIEQRLELSTAVARETTFGDTGLPMPEEPAPPAMVILSSPAEGVFQAGETMNSPPLVEIGSRVMPDTKLGEVQPISATAMPLMAGVAGVVKEILVRDQEMVMAGQALFKIEPTRPNPQPQPN